MIPENPVVGGTVLRRAAIASPNFVTGLTGWSINQDGSAEFNNVVIRNGQVVSGTALFYSGAPALGNLVASIAAVGGTDAKGNAYLSGLASYATGPNTAVALTGDVLNFYTAPGAGGPWTQVAQIAPGSGDLVLQSNRNIAVPGNQIVGSFGLQISGGLTDNVALSNGLAAGKIFQVANTTAAPTSPNVQLTAQAVADFVLGILVAGDTNQRFRVDSDGSHHWGPGNAAVDTALSRTAANTLTNSGTLITTIFRAIAAAAGNQAIDVHVTGDTNPRLQVLGSGEVDWGPGNAAVDTSISRTAANTLTASGTLIATILEAIAAATGNAAIIAETTGDTNPRLQVLGSGNINWGPGNAAVDTTLARTAAGVLTVTSTLAATVLRAIAAATGNQALDVHVTGDTNPRLQATGAGQLDWGPGNAATDCHLARSAANLMQLTTADLDIATAGRGLQIKEGTNARMGTATLSGGTVVVSNTSVTASTRIFLTCNTPGGTPGFLRVSARTAGTSFTILSSSATDTSVVAWLLLEPG